MVGLVPRLVDPLGQIPRYQRKYRILFVEELQYVPVVFYRVLKLKWMRDLSEMIATLH